MRIRSPLRLPVGEAAAVDGAADVEIRRGQVELSEVLAPGATVGFRAEGDTLVLAIRDVGVFAASAGREILVDACDGATEEDLSLYLTGSVLGAILHQRGVFALHASAVEVGGGAVAISGGSGAGKSTMAAFLHARGYPVITDDVSAIVERPGGPAVWPGAPRLKLAREGLAALSVGVDGLAPAGGTREKYLLPVEHALDLGVPVPLRAVYILTDGTEPVRTVRLRGLEAAHAIAQQTYCIEFVQSAEAQRAWFRRAAVLANHAEVKRLVRPRGFRHMEEVLETLESEWRAR